MTVPEELLDLAPLYALDALEAGERGRIDRLIDDHSALRMEIDAYREVAALLAEAVEEAPSTPSPLVWDRIRQEISGGVEKRKPRLVSVADIRKSRRWAWTAALVSAAAVVVSLALGARVLDLQDQVADHSIEELASEAVTSPGSRLVALDGAEGFEAASAMIVLQQDGTGYLLSNTLPTTGPERTYQLWAVVGEGDDTRVISAGVLGNSPGVLQFSAAGDVAAFAITEEPAGGVVVSEGPTVVIGAVDA
ncbi:MAG TPA: anti-sigma factor [Acidimicrobiia bacterium]|jgi:anti-sigma-K factor RskA|nr:anti-sigma factor [Acidimicrobiia bacterium]